MDIIGHVILTGNLLFNPFKYTGGVKMASRHIKNKNVRISILSFLKKIYQKKHLNSRIVHIKQSIWIFSILALFLGCLFAPHPPRAQGTPLHVPIECIEYWYWTRISCAPLYIHYYTIYQGYYRKKDKKTR